MNTVLVVEDDALIGNAIEQWLKQNHQVTWTRTVADTNIALNTAEFDLIVLDLGLPDGSGFDLLRRIKRQKIESGVIILTAYSEVDHRVQGLDLGADDYVVKPVDFRELEARLRSVKRRKDGLVSAVIEHGDLTYDVNGKTLCCNGEPVRLSQREVSIFSILLQGRGRYFSKSMIEERLYEDSSAIEGNAIEVHISSLRKKLGHSLIKTTRGLGYIIEKEPTS